MACARDPLGVSSIRHSSDQEFDFICSVCVEDNKTSEAICYCPVCGKYYCSKCQEFHNRILPDHRGKLQDQSQMMKKVQKPRDITANCGEHDRLVEMYCYDHNVVCCTICLAIHHKQCEHTDYVPKVADGFSKHPDIAKTKSRLQKLKGDLEASKSSRLDDFKRIEMDKKRLVAKVTDFRLRMNEMFATLEEAVIRDADERFDEHNVNIQTDLDKCEEAINKIENILDELNNTDTQNEPNLFINVKTALENMRTWSDLGQKMEDQSGKQSIEFILDGNIELQLKNIKSLGVFADELTALAKPKTIVKTGKVVVKIKKESSTCNIWGMCSLPDGGCLLSDFNNNKIKRLNSSCEVTDTCSIQNPRGVCYIPRLQEAVVCMNGAVKVVAVKTSMKVTKTIKMDGINCYGVVYINDRLFISGLCEKKLHVREYGSGSRRSSVVSSSYIDKIETDKHGNNIFGRTQHVATNNSGTEIWVADRDKGLVVLDRNGNHIRTVSDADMTGARDVCVDNNDNVFACSDNSRSVLQLSADGRKVQTMIVKDELGGIPVSICCDQQRSRLLVALWEADTIKLVHYK